MDNNKIRSGTGFTLIEVLVAMSIVVLIVIMLSRVFTETTNIWNLGGKRIYAATEGRVVMDFLVRELTQAIADENVSFKLNSDDDTIYGVTTYEAGSDEVCFVATVRSGSDHYKRTANQFCYFVSPMLDENNDEIPYRYRLVRTRRTTSMFLTPDGRARSAYNDPQWWRDMEPDYAASGDPALRTIETVAENVAAFEVWAYSEQQRDYVFSYDSTSATEGNLLPLWADIYLEVLDEKDAQQAAIMWEAGNIERAKEFVENNVRRFTARVFFPNRERALAFL